MSGSCASSRAGGHTAPTVDPEKDFSCLCSHGGKGQVQTLLMAAAIAAYAPSGGGPAPSALAAPDSDAARLVYDRIRELGRLHKEGLLTDEEFAAKKAELLGRL